MALAEIYSIIVVSVGTRLVACIPRKGYGM